MKNSKPELAIFTALTATVGKRGGSFVLTRKFIEGVLEYVKLWPGSISVWVQRSQEPDNNLDHVEVLPAELPFRLNWLLGTAEARFIQGVRQADIVLAALVPQHVVLAGMCRDSNVPIVYITEYSEKTRRQIVRTETRNPLLRWRRELWAAGAEKRYRKALSSAAGVQCNGLPTYKAYRELTPSPLLYFDTRVRSGQIAHPDSLQRRLGVMREGGALRLAFSGRLIAMKGADHLPLVARELRDLGVAFTMDICGDGELVPEIGKQIRKFGLDDMVRLRGVMDFKSELLPHMANEVDLFVCCHRQGDPSCTYLETYSCGVPIVGYANEAFSGLAEISEVGGCDWATPMDQPAMLAQRIARLSTRRSEIEIASNRAREFSSENTFETTMEKRIQHLELCLEKMHGKQATS